MLSSQSRPLQHRHRSQSHQPQSSSPRTRPNTNTNMMAVHVHNPSPAYFTYGHSQPSSPIPSPSPFYSQPSSPAASSSSSSKIKTKSQSQPHAPMTTTTLQHSTSLKSRPKLPHKKPSCSTRDKRADVQLNLEMKVEKAKGFHAFFVPLGKSLPPAPPSSPVLGSTHPRPNADGTTAGGKDYFEDWVEDVGRKMGNGHGNAMDLD